MERPTSLPENLPGPITDEEKRESISRLIQLEKANTGSLHLKTQHQEPGFITVNLMRRYYTGAIGTFLFYASSKSHIAEMASAGLIITESDSEMVLTNPVATVREINKKLPAFLKMYYPQIAGVMPREKQKIQTRRIKKAAYTKTSLYPFTKKLTSQGL